jgi:hypothetical protein
MHVSAASLTDTEARQAAHIRRVRAISLPGSFWDTPELEHVKQASQARAAHPDGVLGISLALVSSLVHPSVQVTVGGGATISLNFYSGAVSPPGGGKDRSIATAREVFPIPDCTDTPRSWDMGTGEGLLDVYLEEVPQDGSFEGRTEMIQVHSRAHLIEAEAATLFTLLDRFASLLGSLLLKMWGGTQVGTGNTKTGGRSRSLPDDSYRFAAALGFQPEKISELLRRKGVGFPHRFVLFNAVPETRQNIGADITPLSDRTWWLASLRDTTIALPQEILDELNTINEGKLYEVLDPDVESLDSHLYVLLVKLTVLICLMHGRVFPTLSDFAKARQIVEASDQVRDYAHGVTSREADG